MTAYYIISHDVGTSGDKAVITNLRGEILLTSYKSYPMLYPESKAAEQDPVVLWKAVTHTTKELISISGISPSQIAGIGITTQAFNLLPVDKKGQPLMNMISWADLRSIAQAEFLLEEFGIERFYRWTANAPRAKDVIPRILWLKEKHPDIWKRTHLLMNCKEYIIHRLTGKFAMDLHSASIFFLIDQDKKIWSKNACDALEIPVEMLPEIFPSTELIGKVGSQAASEMGLLAGTPVVLCPADVGAAQVGSGAISVGHASLYIGTGGWVCLTSQNLVNTPENPFWALNHIDPDMYIIGGALDTAGSGFAWFVDCFCQEEARKAKRSEESVYQVLGRMAEKIEKGADGLLFVPWVYGERGHVGVDHYARGAFLGLDLNHQKAHLARAVMEGVAYHYRWFLEELEHAGLQFNSLNAIGGGCSSPLWIRIISDILGRELRVLAQPQEAGSIGAALITAVGLGIYPDIQAVEGFIKFSGTVNPESDAFFYEDRYQEYRDISKHLIDLFEKRHHKNIKKLMKNEIADTE